MVKSLEKGKRFEREVAKLLTRITGVEWKRVPMSGAFSTSQNTKTNVFKGDVFTESKKYKNIVVECKITKQPIRVKELLDEKSLLWKWIKQTEKEAGKNNWFLFFKDNSRKIYLVMKEIQQKTIDDVNYVMLGLNISKEPILHIYDYMFMEVEKDEI